jgi:hypothetical protein
MSCSKLPLCLKSNIVLSRYREVPTFGRDTIRKFSRNCSDMKKLAARDWEDMLQVSFELKLLRFQETEPVQCAIPVFDSLLPEPHNRRLLQLLFLLGYWQGLAKLRLHTETTLQLLDNVTTALGEALRDFKKHVCSSYATKELPREAAARNRREGEQVKKAVGTINCWVFSN